MMGKYEAKHLDGRRYLVMKRRWFGLLPPLSRVAVWDGDHFGSRSRPDFFWESQGGERTEHRLRFRLRWACLREYKRLNNLSPADWTEGLPMAQLVEGK